MSTLLITLLLAMVIILAAVSLLCISWLLTGTSKLQPGACGRDPTKKKDDKSCNVSCHLCEKPKDECKIDDATVSDDEDHAKL